MINSLEVEGGGVLQQWRRIFGRRNNSGVCRRKPMKICSIVAYVSLVGVNKRGIVAWRIAWRIHQRPVAVNGGVALMYQRINRLINGCRIDIRNDVAAVAENVTWRKYNYFTRARNGGVRKCLAGINI